MRGNNKLELGGRVLIQGVLAPRTNGFEVRGTIVNWFDWIGTSQISVHTISFRLEFLSQDLGYI